jgi:hypothetical protein
MSYTRSNFPLWLRAVVGGVSMFAAALVTAGAATWNPQAAWMRGLPEAAVVAMFVVFGVALVAFGLRGRQRGEDVKNR